MPISHGKSFTQWLHAYRAGAGGAETPPLAAELPGVIVIDDVTALVMPERYPISSGRIDSGNFPGQRSGITIIPPSHGCLLRHVQIESGTALWRMFDPGELTALQQLSNNVVSISPAPGDPLGLLPQNPPSRLMIETGTQASVFLFAVNQPIIQEPILSVVSGNQPIFIWPNQRFDIWSTVDNTPMRVNFVIQEVPTAPILPA